MAQIKNIVFDLGGVIITLDKEEPIRRLAAIGVKNPQGLLDPYEQRGIFQDLETGRIDAEAFRLRLGDLAGRELTAEECAWVWLGFVVEVPRYKLDYILSLRERHKVYLLSNTNPFIMDWARTPRFSEAGRPLDDYFDKLYLSYQIGITKPDPRIFRHMMDDAPLLPGETLFVDDGQRNIDCARSLGFHTYLPGNGEDWRERLAVER